MKALFRKYLPIFIILFVIVLFELYKYYINKKIEGTDADYIDSYYIITKDEGTDKIRYYEVNDHGNERTIEKFDSYLFDEVVDVDKYSCFNSYIDREKNKVLNKYLNDCEMTNQNSENVSSNEIYQKIAKQISLLEHDMFDIKIYKINDDYYVTRLKNVNLTSPYNLYKYNIDSDKLELICEIINEEIIGFRKKEEL